MLRRFSSLFSRPRRADDLGASLNNAIAGALSDFDFDDPAQRAGVQLQMILSKQLEVLGVEPGVVPFDDRFASETCRGALLGTALYVVRDQYPEPVAKDYIEATIAAFAIVFGEQIGRPNALKAIQESADGNRTIAAASDWAMEDSKAWDDDNPATPMAYYLAVTGMI